MLYFVKPRVGSSDYFLVLKMFADFVNYSNIEFLPPDPYEVSPWITNPELNFSSLGRLLALFDLIVPLNISIWSEFCLEPTIGFNALGLCPNGGGK